MRLALARVSVSCGELICLLVVLVQIRQYFAISWWTMKVELRIILREQRLHMTLRIRSHHAFFHLVLIAFAGGGSELEILILIKIALLNN